MTVRGEGGRRKKRKTRPPPPPPPPDETNERQKRSRVNCCLSSDGAERKNDVLIRSFSPKTGRGQMSPVLRQSQLPSPFFILPYFRVGKVELDRCLHLSQARELYYYIRYGKGIGRPKPHLRSPPSLLSLHKRNPFPLPPPFGARDPPI